MTCNCMNDLKEKVKDFICEQNGIDPANVVDVRFDNEGYNIMDGGVKESLSIPMTLTHKWKTKAGKDKESKVPTFITPSFCPFCGKAVDE